MSEAPPSRARVAPELLEEFPRLALWTAQAAGSTRSSPREVRERLRGLADRYTGARAVQVRQQPVPWAYRVFFRQVGLDPDEHRTAPEEIALRRMQDGGFPSRNLLEDALTIATVETGVPLIALDAQRVRGGLELRLARRNERLGCDGRELSYRQVVLADAECALAAVFADLAEGRGVSDATRRVLLAAVQVSGVPDVAVEEALWIALDVLATAR